MALPAVIPSPVLLVGTGTGAATQLTDFAEGYDYAIAGIPFVSAVDHENPLEREGVQIQKPRQDYQEEPGEQTFMQWWTRAQSGFHCGAGLKYRDIRQSSLESETSQFEHYRFQTSAGVNPWIPGQVSLLNAAPVVKTGTTPLVIGATDTSGNVCFLIADGAAVVKITETLAADGNGVIQPTYSSPTTVAWGGTGTIQSITTDGTNYYIVDTAGVWAGNIATPAVTATKIYTLGALVVNSGVISWVKQRLALALNTTTGSFLYQLNNNATVGSALPSPTMTHPNAAWVWTSIDQGPSAVYAAGYAGHDSAAYSLVLTSSGDFPVLTTGATAIEMPSGERILALKGSMGTVMGVATSAGFRLAFFQGATVQVGPLILNGTCYGAIGLQDRFFFVGYKDANAIAGLARIDAGMPLSHQLYSYSPEVQYAWAPDLRAEDGAGNYLGGAVTSVAAVANRLVFAVTGQGTFVQHPSKLVAYGTILTSRERMNTLELKLARFLRIRAEASYGTVSAAVGVNSDTPGPAVITLAPVSTQDSGDILIEPPPSVWYTMTFTLTRQSSARPDQGPIFSGFQVKCLPVVNKQRMLRVPLACYDNEMSRTGQELPTNPAGNALARVLALEAHENAGDIVTFQLLSAEPNGSYSALVTIEDISYKQLAGPMERSGVGGTLTVTVRTVQ